MNLTEDGNTPSSCKRSTKFTSFPCKRSLPYSPKYPDTIRIVFVPSSCKRSLNHFLKEGTYQKILHRSSSKYCAAFDGLDWVLHRLCEMQRERDYRSCACNGPDWILISRPARQGCEAVAVLTSGQSLAWPCSTAQLV